MNNPGAGREMVQAHIGSDRFPVWSPDGSQIAFASQRTADPNQTGQFNIYVMDSACLILPEGCTNAEVEAVTTFTVQDAIHPAWSPDGNEIAFTTYNPFYTDDPQYDYSDTVTFFQIYRRSTSETSGAMNLSAMSQTGEWSPVFTLLSTLKAINWWLFQQAIPVPYVCNFTMPDQVNVYETIGGNPTLHNPTVRLWIVGKNHATGWFRVYYDVNSSQNGLGWVSPNLFYNIDPCQNDDDDSNLPEIAPDGSSATPTPTVTPTPNVTATPYPIYPSPTPGTPTPPQNFTLCGGSSEQWRKDLCLQGWNYLDDSERLIVLPAITNGVLTSGKTYQETDRWWLDNIHRGIGDVPSRAWNIQCNGDIKCASILSNVTYLYDNMRRIGIDMTSIGLGQQSTTWLPSVDGGTPFNDAAQAWVACSPGQTGVCWVCQDLPTQLYLNLPAPYSFDFQNTMLSIPAFKDTARWPEPNYLARQTIAVATLLRDYGSDIGTLTNGNQTSYQVGDMLFLTNGAPQFLAASERSAVSHVGVVIKGGSDPTQVLIAQISYSSEGFYPSYDYFTSAAYTGKQDAPNGGLGEYQTVGRFEVITLQTYLYKHLSNSENRWVDSPINYYPTGIPSSPNEDNDALHRYTLVGRLSS